ncbi:acyl-CoA thioester hydrolase/BAAT C-terminal domain-containing protein [Piscinibacterium candidicorallinum]|uniref:Acyl-CoA thioester hydrolase/BAAT C-terminal domain-containing protein n=1 Tax=Piscinibacterium candidicorallinum TaxID=1793872 RepID=A0ABV7H3P5_9BURK
MHTPAQHPTLLPRAMRQAWLIACALGAALFVQAAAGQAPEPVAQSAPVAVPQTGPRFAFDPPEEFVPGDRVSLRIQGLAPGSRVHVTAQRPREEGGAVVLFESQALFTASPRGEVNLATDAPVNGSYEDADLRGLFWSMRPTKTARPAGWLASEVRFTARQDSAAGAVITEGKLRVTLQRPGVTVERVVPFEGAVLARPAEDAQNGATGAATPLPRKRPALILLGGSEGGSRITADAPLWASHGYVALALPYYSPPSWGPTVGADGKPIIGPDGKPAMGPQPAELPSLPPSFVDIPIDRLQTARDWLAQQPGVDADRIGIMGTSKGAEFVLLAATRMPWVRAVVAVVPTDVVWEGWGPDAPVPGQRSSFSWQGKPLPFVPYKGMNEEFAGFATGAEVRLRRPQDAGREAHPDRVAAARIPVENYAGPLLLIGGMDDQVWASGPMARNIADARRRANLPVVSLVYEGGGHALGGHGWSPTTTYNATPYKIGGTPAAEARSQADAFAKTIQFLRSSLGQ